jgi:hypothetical protein
MSRAFVARWDLDKTYLRTEFDTLEDLVRTALERAEQKRTVPGAAPLLRELAAAGAEVHILSGSPRQMRARLEEKLRLDGVQWESFTLKPNLRNILTLRLRAVRDQLGYKLPALLRSRAAMNGRHDAGGGPLREVLFGDDAESDAFVYSLYADVVAGAAPDELLEQLMHRNRSYDSDAAEVLRYARLVDKGPAVEKILIHLDRQSAPSDFAPYGHRVVPFFNYLQAAFVLQEMGRLPAAAVVRVAIELVVEHRFDGDALARSYLDLARRGHLDGTGAEAIDEAFRSLGAAGPLPGAPEIERMCERLLDAAPHVSAGVLSHAKPDYLRLVELHDRRKKRR